MEFIHERMQWAKYLLQNQYVLLHARIALWKAGLLPVDDADEAERLVKAEMDRVEWN